MLKYFFENDLINYSDQTIDKWQDAIQESCQTLLKKEYITQAYVDEIIECVSKYGPYIVIVPGVAMPHSSEDSQGVKGTAINFTKMKNPIEFESGNPEKTAQLFFTLAAKNPEEHMQNIAKLSDMLMTEGLIEDLTATNSLEDYQRVMTKYSL